MRRTIPALLWLAATLSLAALAGCGGEPTTFPTPASELGQAPGLLTGPAGEFTLYPRDPPPPR